MTGPQIAAFANSTGGIAPATLLLAIASILAIIYLLWLAWIAYSQLRSWQHGQGDFYDVMFIVTRAAVISLLVGFFIR
jgi:integrating conjugative element protein (TIGR03758 family)